MGMSNTGWKSNQRKVRQRDEAANNQIIAIWERVQRIQAEGCGCHICRSVPASGARRGTHPMDWMQS